MADFNQDPARSTADPTALFASPADDAPRDDSVHSDAARFDAAVIELVSADGPPIATEPPKMSATARRGWLRSNSPPLRAPRRLFVRLLIAFTSGTALLSVAALVAAAAIIPPIGARRLAREAAQREVESQLSDGERLVATTFASQRRWTDMWRESFGIVVATDRRLLYVGAPPTPLLRPIDEGPDELLVESYPYDAAFTLDPRTLFRGYGRGLVLRTPLRTVDFIVDDANWNAALAVSAASANARSAVTRGIEALDASTRPNAPRAEVYERYVVTRGETLTSIARRFHTTPDVLMQLNQLRTGNIEAGQRLRVPSVGATLAPTRADFDTAK